MPIPRQEADRVKQAEDVRDVFIFHTKTLDEFDPKYQQILKDAYRFSAWRYTSDDPMAAPRTRETLDLV
jgi:hypothetical protein